jgi:hypothetical protein
MKKIFILIITFTLILITGSKTFAIDTYGYNLNMPLAEFDGLSIRQWFDANQLVTNGDFENGATGWNIQNRWTYNSLGFLSYNNTGVGYFSQNISIIDTNHYYFSLNVEISGGIANFLLANGSAITIDSGPYREYTNGFNSSIYKANLSTSVIRFYAKISSNSYNVDNLSLINITQLKTNQQFSPMFNTTFDLMTDAQIKEQLDYWVELYQSLKIPYYNTFFDNIIISINDITNQTQLTIQETFDYLYDGENLTHTGQIITIFFSTALIASILILLFRSWRF